MNRRLFLAAALLSSLATPAGAQQNEYPTRPVRLIVPAAAGGATDLVARLIAQHLSQSWPHPMVVENRPGGGGVIGTQVVARAPADGYTLLMGAINHTINASLVKNLPYDTVGDFTFIAGVVSIPNVLVVNPKVPVHSVTEFIRYSQTHDDLTFASSGNGTSQHLSAETFRMATGAKYQHVPYKGSAPAVTDLLGGHVDLMFDNLPSAAPNIRAGKLRALGVTSAQRNPAFPDIPAIAETVPGFDVKSWFGLMGPAGLPREVIDKLHVEMVRVFAQNDVQQWLDKMGAQAQVTDPAAFDAYVHQEIKRWAEVVKASGATVQ
ncbi:tripartite tricarboxylate transporter substrate binding protein [Bordetella sp. BOR01]|uniref:Bug family tripartite tricarboxylate transporter substrate binding protein n=1 Tax=Bordetella sp. BOR01 TaxID=2854779 RepID=UPI001C477726|nr:tripartite tricarboxylate transporter substrate binding protein [Bordetella sp. BOR01]MBV7483340.1 tripartite tricarboxylate transporter substrate binding protein [Bordetella sp. BOR01]